MLLAFARPAKRARRIAARGKQAWAMLWLLVIILVALFLVDPAALSRSILAIVDGDARVGAALLSRAITDRFAWDMLGWAFVWIVFTISLGDSRDPFRDFDITLSMLGAWALVRAGLGWLTVPSLVVTLLAVLALGVAVAVARDGLMRQRPLRRNRYRLVVAASLLTLATVVAMVKLAGATDYRLPQQGERAPHFAVHANNNIMDLPSAGEANVIVFWATWCGPCKTQLAAMATRDFNGRVWAVNTDDYAAAKRLFEQRKWPKSWLAFTDEPAIDAYGATVTPTTIITDNDGFIRNIFRGQVQPGTIQSGLR